MVSNEEAQQFSMLGEFAYHTFEYFDHTGYGPGVPADFARQRSTSTRYTLGSQ